MKLMKGLVVALALVSSLSFAQEKVLFACQVPAGKILKNEAMLDVIVQSTNGTETAVINVLGNAAAFDDKAAADTQIALGFDQVTTDVVDDANQILTDYVLGTDYADVLTEAGVTDASQIAAVYTFSSVNSQSQDYALQTYVFLDAKDQILGSAVVLFLTQNGQTGAIVAACELN